MLVHTLIHVGAYPGPKPYTMSKENGQVFSIGNARRCFRLKGGPSFNCINNAFRLAADRMKIKPSERLN